MENPYKKLSKINPQREKGNRQIANDVFIALIMAKLTGAEYQITLFILDKTWGFDKTSDGISYSQMTGATRLTRPGVINTMKKLETRRIIIVDRKLVNNSLPFNEYLFNKHYDTWLNKTGQPQFTSLEIDQIRKNIKLVNQSLPDIDQTGKQMEQKLVNSRNKTSKPGFTYKRNLTKEINTKETIILSQIKNLLSQFPLEIKDMVEEYIELAKLENKTKQITYQKELRLINELHLLWTSCDNPILQSDFEGALHITINNEAPNVNYVKKVMKSIIRARSVRIKKGKENKEIFKEAVNGYS